MLSDIVKGVVWGIGRVWVYYEFYNVFYILFFGLVFFW